MRALRHGFERGDLSSLIVGGGVTFAVALVTVHAGTKAGAGTFLAFATFCVVVVGWVIAPHVVAAGAIPLFVAIPALKALALPWIGPAKDIVIVAAAVALLWRFLQRRNLTGAYEVEHVTIVLVVAFLFLYVVNLGGTINGAGHDTAWAQGVRLIGEPLILLVAGLTFTQPRRTLNLSVGSLVATGVGVALYGIYQQLLGAQGLVDLGYSYGHQVRKIGGLLRSFGTLDEPFSYATFLLLALVAALFWMRRGPLKLVCMSVITVGLLFAYVRSALVISVALVALWLLSTERLTLGILLLATSAAVALVLLFAVAGANETRSVRAGPNTYITLNGRTTVWATVFARPSNIPLGLGVGRVGTAAERAQYGVTADPNKATKSIAVDSGYFATVADVGLLGLLVLIALLTRVVVLGVAAAKRAGMAGWLVLGWLTVLLIDAATRASFTGFPQAFLGMLLVGLGIAAARPEIPGLSR